MSGRCTPDPGAVGLAQEASGLSQGLAPRGSLSELAPHSVQLWVLSETYSPARSASRNVSLYDQHPHPLQQHSAGRLLSSSHFNTLFKKFAFSMRLLKGRDLCALPTAIFPALRQGLAQRRHSD